MLGATRSIVLCLILLCPTFKSYAAPDVAKILRTTSPAIVSVQSIQWVKIKVPEQYKGVTKDPVYQAFSRIFSDPNSSLPTTDTAPVVKKKNQGNGFIISTNGIIVTNYHTVVGAHEIYVQLYNKRRLKATLLRSEPKRDLAILKVAAGSLPTLALANEITEGEWVIAVGANGTGASSGIVLNSPAIKPSQGLLTDVDISSANTGGPLLNTDGEALAMNSSLLKTTRGFTKHILVGQLVNAKDFKATLPQTWQQLGFSAQNITDTIQQKQGLSNAIGAWVKSVQPNSIAAKAGLQTTDVIVALESQRVVDVSDLSALRDFLSQDDKVALTVMRAGEAKVLHFVIAKPATAVDEINGASWARLGLKVRPISATQKTALGVTSGLQITAVQKGAASAGLNTGDFIFGINQQDLKSAEQLNSLVQKLPAGETAFIYISQENIRQFVGVVLE